ncbi:YesL family protein [Bacillus sinesaloumensis]|uniref:YesL family protein n=1 Tax=Litchfieldia sinesaloumensis TaxID=1926280 RepID=UPI0009884E65|nr:DUF624 domain-containing protein [Bacillus sinesaloumensis]
MEKFILKVNEVCIWIFRLSCLNILWIVFTLLGLGIFGLFPATVAVFAVTRKWVMKEEPKLFITFWDTYKKEFLKVNLLGYLLLFFGLFLYLDLHFFRSIENSFVDYLPFIYIPIVILYLFTVLYIFPVYVHFELKFIHIIKNAFLFAISSPIISILMVIGISLVYLILYMVPIFIIFFSVSLVSFVIMWCANLAFLRYHLAQQKMGNNETFN